VSDVELHVGDDWPDVVGEVLADAAGAAQQIALTGGKTPGRAYQRAAELRPDWSRAGVWWSDERCVEPDDDRANYKLARDTLLSRLDALPRVHRIRGEMQRDAAADEYERELGDTRIDVMLLGVGPDGHVASLFPGKPSLKETQRRVVGSEPALEPWVDRVTLTLPALRGAKEILYVVSGEAKVDAVRRAFAEPPSPETPASLVRADSGRTTVIVDRAAAAAIDA
jgi:6-phosphogluconolactonase